jgi:hypothetical protein
MLSRRVLSEKSVPTTREIPASRSAILLAEAGLIVYQKALKEQLALAHIAEQSGRPQYWFANHIIQVVGVYGKVPGEKTLVHLMRDITNGLKLDDEMTALFAPEETKARYIELQSDKSDIDKYMDWARTVF